MNTQTLRNQFTYAEFREDEKQIFLRDLTDQNNDPAEYNQTVRGLKKAVATLFASWTDTMTMHEASTILSNCGIRMHYFCMMD
jgi:hypothetical protein